MSKRLLTIEDLHVSYGRTQALHGISLAVPLGSIVCLIGANGAGKSTTLRTISGLIRPDSGAIRYNGMDLTTLQPHEIVRTGLVQCPEGRGIFPNLTVAENLDLGAYVREDSETVTDDLNHVYELFPRLHERADQMAGTLSGGEQQMLAIGRSLMARPSLLLLDEPSLGLAPQVIDTIFSIIERINREGTSILLVEQNASMALEIAHEAWVLETGRIALQGPAGEIARDPRVREAYLGH